MKKCEQFSLTSFGTLEYYSVIKKIEIFNFLSLINNSVTIAVSFLYLIKSINKLLILPFHVF